MVVLSTKFTILNSWSPICITLILLSVSMKLASMSAAVMDSSIESGHPWWTLRIWVKGSDRRPFILILGWILVYVTLIMWTNLSPYPNFCKEEKIKSQSIQSKFLRNSKYIMHKNCYSVYWTHWLCHKQ